MVKPHESVSVLTGTVNTTDHDSRVVRTQGQPLQGCNAQLAVNDQQVWSPTAARAALRRTAAGLDEPAIVVADAGYPLAAPDQERAAAPSQMAFRQSERLLDPQSCSPQDHDHGA